ncbi:hypothetical protein [Polluticoccus soli]|uniref:hypothetical protein n=1 Tax=Polluticoccus soli TaxID=3034150 RepID=UPI0023E32D50|nr:hypothetical protein [Flavipsychrobacter sp. JY13-12]
MLEARGFSFSFLTEIDTQAHKDFVARNWPNAVTRSNYEYNKWKYGQRSDGSINLLLCKKGNEVVGQIGYIPARLIVDGKEHDCVWGCNFKVEDAYRELGIGAALEIYASNTFPIILGNTPSIDSIKYKRSLGYKMLEGPRVMMFPVKADHLLQLKGSRLPEAVLQVATAVANPVLRRYNELRLRANTGEWLQANEHSISQRIVRRENETLLPHIKHDEAFLQWRLNVPAGLREKAKMYTSPDDDRSYAITSIAGKVLNIYDYCFSDKTVLKSFLKQVSCTDGISTIRIQANSNEEEVLLRESGFIPFRSKAVITAYSRDGLFDKIDKMYVTGYDGDIDL